MSKKRNYSNYYSGTQKTVHKNYYNSNQKTVTEKKEEKKPEEPVIEEEVVESKPEISPEEKIEKTEQKPKKKVFPDRVELIDNIYIREKPDGHNIPKEDLDRLTYSKVIKDYKGDAMVPKGTRVDVYDVTETEDGTVYYNTKFGYLMAKNKNGDEYVKELVY